MTRLRDNIFRSAIMLMLFALVGTGILSLTNELTRQRIAQNEIDEVLHNLHAIITPDKHDNDIFKDILILKNATLLGTDKAVVVYRARKQGKPVAAVFSSIAPNGYNGTIKLLIGVRYDGQLTGVRVISHHETPGLGDAIEVDRSDWILGFDHKSLKQPEEKYWKVKKDGGVFDQFTGATITPRAIVNAVKNTLLYFRQHRDDVFKNTGKNHDQHQPNS